MEKFAKLFECADDFQLVVQKSFDKDGACLKCSTMNLDGLHVEADLGFITSEGRDKAFAGFDQEKAEELIDTLLGIGNSAEVD